MDQMRLKMWLVKSPGRRHRLPQPFVCFKGRIVSHFATQVKNLDVDVLLTCNGLLRQLVDNIACDFAHDFIVAF